MSESKKRKFKATKKFDVNAHDNYKGLGQDNHARLSKGGTVELEIEPGELIKNKMIEEVGGKK